MPLNAPLFENKLAMLSAPTLLTLKVASLLTIYKETFPNYKECISYFNKKFQNHHIHIEILKEREETLLLYIYHIDRLYQLLHQENIQEFLSQYGYNQSIAQNIRLLKSRMNHDAFPHEIGIFLGYPITDVLGFINDDPCHYVGYWKVYSHVYQTKKKFYHYDCCKRMMIKQLNQGYHIIDILNKYN